MHLVLAEVTAQQEKESELFTNNLSQSCKSDFSTLARWGLLAEVASLLTFTDLVRKE